MRKLDALFLYLTIHISLWDKSSLVILLCDALPYLYLRKFLVYLQYGFDSQFILCPAKQKWMSNGHLSEYSLVFFLTLGYILMPPNPHIPHINQGQYARNNHNCQPQETRMHFA